MQGVAELIAALGRNPLPDAFVVTPRGEGIGQLAGELARLPGVAHVQADAAWARRLAAAGAMSDGWRSGSCARCSAPGWSR